MPNYFLGVNVETSRESLEAFENLIRRRLTELEDTGDDSSSSAGLEMNKDVMLRRSLEANYYNLENSLIDWEGICFDSIRCSCFSLFRSE